MPMEMHLNFERFCIENEIRDQNRQFLIFIGKEKTFNIQGGLVESIEEYLSYKIAHYKCLLLQKTKTW